MTLESQQQSMGVLTTETTAPSLANSSFESPMKGVDGDRHDEKEHQGALNADFTKTNESNDDDDDDDDVYEDDEGEDEDLETEMILAELIAVHKNERARRGSRTGANCKPVQQISTFGKVINEFKSGIIAAHALGINSNGISKVCLGYQEHTMGFRFRFKP